MTKDTKKVLLKTVTWRVIGISSTMVLTWLITGDMTVAWKMMAAHAAVNTTLYYLHEKFWLKFDK